MNIKNAAVSVLVLLFFIITALLLLFFLGRGGENGDRVRVKINGETAGEYSLFDDAVYTLNGGSNVLIIENGKARMEKAECPDKICVRKGWVWRNGESIVCLPNRVIVEVINGRKEADLVI